MPKLGITASALALGSVLAGLMGAQNAPQAEGGPTIHATVNEVALDLVVRDKKGRLVRNLKPDDVEIYEDGVRQEIRSLRLVSGGGAPGQSLKPPVQPAPQPAEPEAGPHATEHATEHAPALPLRSLNLICIVFHNLDSGTRKWAVAAAQDFIVNEVPAGTFVGVFNLDSRLTPLYPFTINRNELLRAAANAFTGSTVDITRAADAALNSTPNVQWLTGFVSAGGKGGGIQDLSTTGSVSLTAITGADVDNGPGANSQRGDLVLERRQFIGVEGARQMDQVKLLIRELGKFPGHKTVLLLSAGLTTTGDPDQFQAMLNKANLGDLSVYAFDANGLNQTSTAQASSMAMQHVVALSQQQRVESTMKAGENAGMGSSGVVAELSRQDDYQHDAVRTSDTQSGLRALAEGTGGFLVANTNDLRKPFQQIATDADTHYEADYHPSSAKYDGHFRKIDVKMARADLVANARVESRDGYFAIPDFGGTGPLRPFEMAGLMTLNGTSLPHTFAFRTAAFQFRPGVPSSQSAVVFELPGASLTAVPQPGRLAHRLHASLFAVVKDSNGQIVDKFARDFPYEVPDTQLAGIQSAPIDYTHAFHLPAGSYTVESVLFDREAHRASTSAVELEIPRRTGLALSSLMVVARTDLLTADADNDDPFLFQGRDVVPMLDGSVKPGAQPSVYFVVYPDKSNQETPRIRVEFFAGGEELEAKDTDLPAPDSSGAIPMVVSAVARPGKCEIRITARQGFQSAAQSVSYTVAAP